MDLMSIVGKIPADLPAWIMWVLPFILEFILRAWPTVKPKSLLLAVAVGLKAVAVGAEKLSVLADKIGQNLKAE
jgi:hypothetical protein